ncbi:MAG: VWA domain-containing protein [Tepidisphaeraceae bacterium]
MLYTCLAILTVITMVGVLGLDGGKMIYSRSQLADAVDASARAGAAAMSEGLDARTAVIEFLSRNVPKDCQFDVSKVTVTTGRWDSNTNSFHAGYYPMNALKVDTQQTYGGSIFNKVTGGGPAKFNVSATAAFQQRDLMLVLDYSGSMNTDNKVGSLRMAVDTFCDAVQEAGGGKDQVGLVTYSDVGGLDLGLQTGSFPLGQIKQLAQSKLADGATNISEGLQRGIDELQLHSRPGAAKIILLLTDGLANRPTTGDPIQLTKDQALCAAANDITIYTVAFGNDADQTLMKWIADNTGGTFHPVPSGWTQTSDLQSAFHDAAVAQSTRLVK